MLSNEKQLSVVLGVIKLAAAMNLVMYADGITDLQTMKKLKQLGCLYGQGPYFSSVVGAEAIAALLESNDPVSHV